jgi:hypothetical protein
MLPSHPCTVLHGGIFLYFFKVISLYIFHPFHACYLPHHLMLFDLDALGKEYIG